MNSTPYAANELVNLIIKQLNKDPSHWYSINDLALIFRVSGGTIHNIIVELRKKVKINFRASGRKLFYTSINNNEKTSDPKILFQKLRGLQETEKLILNDLDKISLKKAKLSRKLSKMMGVF